MNKGKGNGKHPAGTRWLMRSGVWIVTCWVTQGHYTDAEVRQWEISSPVRRLYPLDIEL